MEPPETLDGLVGTALYEAQVKYKTKMLGNIKLVGELINHGMLVSKITIAVSDELVRDDPVVREERLETLAVFLETIGPELDDPSWAHHQGLCRIFKEVERLTFDASLPCRIRCILQDVVDLRRSHWLGKKVRRTDADAPTTIAEVHQRAGGESSSSAAGPQRGGSKRRPGGDSSDGGVNHKKPSTPSFIGHSPPASSRASPCVSPKRNSKAEVAARPAQSFHTELAGVVRLVGSGGLAVTAAAERIGAHKPLAAGRVVEEAADVIARIVDEPTAARQRLLPLLPALVKVDLFVGPNVLERAVEAFAREAFADPEDWTHLTSKTSF